jgi:hypothetical protein
MTNLYPGFQALDLSTSASNIPRKGLVKPVPNGCPQVPWFELVTRRTFADRRSERPQYAAEKASENRLRPGSQQRR